MTSSRDEVAYLKKKKKKKKNLGKQTNKASSVVLTDQTGIRVRHFGLSNVLYGGSNPPDQLTRNRRTSGLRLDKC